MSDRDPFELDDEEDTSSASDEDRRLRAAEHESDMRWLIDNTRGRRFLRHLLDQAGVFRLSFNGDALTTAFREGERRAGLVLLAEITVLASPIQLASILTEDQYGR